MRRREFAMIVAAVVVAAALLAYFSRGLGAPLANLLGILDSAVGVLSLLSWLGGPKLEVKPLPHLKGWMRPGGSNEDWELYLGDEPRIGVKPTWGRPTDPERVGHGMHPAQVLELVWPDPKQHPGNKLAPPGSPIPGPEGTTVRLNFQVRKFGVLSVTNRGGEAEHCSAHGKYRLKGWPAWRELGELNWYSRSRVIALKQSTHKHQQLAANTVESLNDVLANPYIDVPKHATAEDECDLPLFYMMCEPATPYVFMAGAEWAPYPAQATADHHLRMAIKVRFKARGMEPFTKRYRASVAPDDFEIWEETASDPPI
jgi:hypothetical protein